MNKGTDWESLDWLSSARGLVRFMNERSPEDKILVFVRHSHRDTIEDHSEQLSTGLTELGKQTSYEMGKRLPVGRPFHFFFSFIPRCHQTAEEMSRAVREKGGEVVEMETIPVLVAPEIHDQAVWDELHADGENVHNFVNRWADSEFGEMIEEFDQYKAKLLADTIERLEQANRPVVHVHVTHDLAIMAMKRILSQRSLTHEDREPYLGGIAIAIDQTGSQHQFIMKK